MPRIDDLKDYFIESEEDIPEEYRKQLSTQIEEINSIPIISGEKGNVIEEENEIADIFGDEQTGYLGHGTIGGEEIVNLIFQTGLKVKNPKAVRSYDNHLRGVASTTIEWGDGEPDLFNKIKEKLRNWPHNEAKDIIIISIPKEYILSTAVRLGTDRYEAVCVGSEEEGYKLRPEFIKGVYNANTHSFTLNDNFYKNLPQEIQQQLLENVKQRYIALYADRSAISPKEDTELSLEGEDLEKLTLEWYKVQFKKLKEHQNKMQSFDNELFEICGDTNVTDFNEMSETLRRENEQEQTEEYERSGCW